ncbi:hypothetical protein [Fluviispira multicolorata]|uniref:Uncharacterized protein n=1 Tax=Fluviispira multicolorata TaxID=2654512 RepID=A0A833N4A3_9BACT|nr:hypothetical protein [Fluviispira multicolorata]KAB8031821.1 hypothetical protein GCL57_04040 [Fluviispira multicolorata]
MFDKNEFKNCFRKWLDENPSATYEEAKSFCESQIPSNAQEHYAWLAEQSIAWFLWRKENQSKENLNLHYSEDESDNYLTTKKDINYN